MERVVFIIESTGDRIGCLLNPESLVLKRLSGVDQRRSAGGIATGSNLADDPLFFTGGGTTELTLDLLFDVNLSGSTIEADDVRELTGPLWSLAENAAHAEESRRPPAARFIWGKAWNVPGVVTAVAERLDYFTPEGCPQRAWLRLRMIRTPESEDDLVGGAIAPPSLPEDPAETPPPAAIGENDVLHGVIGSDPPDAATPGGSERLDELAFRYYGDPAAWRVLAWVNGIADPLRLPVGAVLHVASRTDFEGRR